MYPFSFDTLTKPTSSTIRAAGAGVSPADTMTGVINTMRAMEYRLGLVTPVAFTADSSTDTFTSNSHGLTNGQIVMVTTTTTLPGGLAINTAYYVINSATNTFKLSATSGGSAIDITSNGTGTQTFVLLDLPINAAALALKANIASPTFTGTPAAPTAAAATNTTQLATTAFVFAERSNTFTLTNKSFTGLVGFGTTSPTHTITLDSTATGIALYNTSDQVTNYERVRGFWSANVFSLMAEKGGSGTLRNMSINGNVTIDPSGNITPAGRITPREATTASSATPTPNSDTTDIYTVTALATAPTFGAPTGTPVQGQKLIIRIKDNATARALAWNAIYRAIGNALPSTTIISKTLYLGFMYNSTDTKWDLIGVSQEV